MIVEVSDSTLTFDRRDKAGLYAAAGIPVYWIVNLIDRVVEVHTDPTPEGEYKTKREFGLGETVPVELDGIVVGTILTSDLF